MLTTIITREISWHIRAEMVFGLSVWTNSSFILATGWTPFGDSASIPDWGAVGFFDNLFFPLL